MKVHVVLTMPQAMALRSLASEGWCGIEFDDSQKFTPTAVRGMMALEDAIEKATGKQFQARISPRTK